MQVEPDDAMSVKDHAGCRPGHVDLCVVQIDTFVDVRA